MSERTEYFSEGEFQVVKTNKGDLASGEKEAESWITHICTEFAHDRPFYTVSGILMNSELLKEECAFCFKRIPANVIALWRLHNWDYSL